MNINSNPHMTSFNEQLIDVDKRQSSESMTPVKAPSLYDTILAIESQKELTSLFESFFTRLENVENKNCQLVEKVNQLSCDIVKLQQKLDSKVSSKDTLEPFSECANEVSLVNLYNTDPKSVKKNATKVGVTIQKVRDDSVLFNLEINQRGYWLVDELYLVPRRPSSRYNDHSLPILEALFTCRNVQLSRKNFNLIKPARISVDLNRESSLTALVQPWKLVEKGIIEFTEAKISPNTYLVECPSANSDLALKITSNADYTKDTQDSQELTAIYPEEISHHSEEAPQLTAPEQEFLSMYNRNKNTEFWRTIKATCSLDAQQALLGNCVLKADRWGAWNVCKYGEIYYLTPSSMLIINPDTLVFHQKIFTIQRSKFINSGEFCLIKPGIVRRNSTAQCWEIIEKGVLQIST